MEKMFRYKVGLFKDETNYCYPSLVAEYNINRHETDDPFFVRWLTDWVEHEDKLEVKIDL